MATRYKLLCNLTKFEPRANLICSAPTLRTLMRQLSPLAARAEERTAVKQGAIEDMNARGVLLSEKPWS